MNTSTNTNSQKRDAGIFFGPAVEETRKKEAPDDFLYVKANHLGNVLVVVSDRKVPQDNTAPPDNTIDFYRADIVSVNDYFSFGMPMPGRNYNSPNYRYGFNGKEKVDEVVGSSGVTYDYGFRIYDARLGRFLSVDPLAHIYPSWSPYNFALNNPIRNIDVMGMGPGDPDDPEGTMKTDNGTKFSVGDFKNQGMTQAINQETGECYGCVQTDDGKRNASSFNISNEGLGFIKAYEGLETEMYNDQADNATIGYGHLIHYGKVGTDPTSEKPYEKGITEISATTLLQNDVVSYENTVKSTVTTRISQSQYDALVIFEYNTGGLSGSTLLKRVNASATAEKITDAFLMWNKVTQDGKKVVSPGLTNRRTDEAELFNTADYIRNH